MAGNLSGILERVCAELAHDADAAAVHELSRWPIPMVPAKRGAIRPALAMQVFKRDGFIDRYSGERLVNPGVLRLLSIRLPADFPVHPNWKVGATHPAIWYLTPTADHVVPVARGGTEAIENLVTTSQLRNSAKAHSTLEELGWRLHTAGALTDWDGLTQWLLAETTRRPELLKDRKLADWVRCSRSSE